MVYITMVLSGVPRKLIRNALRVWQDILAVETQHGVFVIRNEIKTVAIETPEAQAGLDQMVDDLPDYFVGLFDRHGDYQQFLSDVAVTAHQISKREWDLG